MARKQKQVDPRFEVMAALGRADLYFFATEILGNKVLEPNPHEQMAKDVSGPEQFKLLLWPRDTFKSLLSTQSYALWRIIRDPNIRILITNATLGNSKAFLDYVKTQLEGNQLLRACYGNYVSEKWTQEAITVSKRTNIGLKEPTIEIASTGASKVSRHYDLIIADDLVNRDWVSTPEMVERSVVYFKDLIDLMAPGCQLLIIGTRWAYHDLYGYLIEEYNLGKEGQDPRWKYSRREIVSNGDVENGELLFPARHDREKVKALLRDKGWYEFSCQWLNSPTPESDKRLTPAEYYTILPKTPLNYYVTVDPAISQKESADPSVVMCCAVDPENNLYVVDYVEERLTPRELINLIFDYDDRYRPRVIGIETVAYQKALVYFLEEEMRARGHFLLVEELKADKDKFRRIMALEPRFSNGTIFIKQSMYSLRDQINNFPFIEHDDCVDALAYMLQIIKKPPKKISVPRQTRRYRNPFTGY